MSIDTISVMCFGFFFFYSFMVVIIAMNFFSSQVIQRILFNALCHIPYRSRCKPFSRYVFFCDSYFNFFYWIIVKKKKVENKIIISNKFTSRQYINNVTIRKKPLLYSSQIIVGYCQRITFIFQLLHYCNRFKRFCDILGNIVRY